MGKPPNLLFLCSQIQQIEFDFRGLKLTRFQIQQHRAEKGRHKNKENTLLKTKKNNSLFPLNTAKQQEKHLEVVLRKWGLENVEIANYQVTSGKAVD